MKKIKFIIITLVLASFLGWISWGYFAEEKIDLCFPKKPDKVIKTKKGFSLSIDYVFFGYLRGKNTAEGFISHFEKCPYYIKNEFKLSKRERFDDPISVIQSNQSNVVIYVIEKEADLILQIDM